MVKYQLPNFVHRGRSIPLSLHHHDPSRYSNPTDGDACFDPKQKKEGSSQAKKSNFKINQILKTKKKKKNPHHKSNNLRLTSKDWNTPCRRNGVWREASWEGVWKTRVWDSNLNLDLDRRWIGFRIGACRSRC